MNWASTLTTTHLGHRIEIGRFEWGYVARIVASARHEEFTVASPSANRALSDALAIVDDWQVADAASASSAPHARP